MNHSSSGVLYAIAAYGFWGLTPLYWKAVEVVPLAIHSLDALRASGGSRARPPGSGR